MITRLLDRFIDTYNINPKVEEKGRKDAAFELLACTVAFGRSPYYAKDMCWNSNFRDGIYYLKSNDGKIDGYDILCDEDLINIKLMQSKNSDSISTNDIREFFNSVKHYIINLTCELPTEFEGLEKLREIIIDTKKINQDADVNYELILVCLGINETTRTNVMRDFKAIFKQVGNVIFTIISEEEIIRKITLIKKKIRNDEYEEVKINIDFGLRTEIKNYSKSDLVIGAISAKMVHHIINKEFEKNIDLSRLFSGNVRGFLGDTEVNLEIKKTIETAAVTFLSKNNGAVIICDKITPDGDNKINMTNPIIINGQQTFASIYKYAKSDSMLDKIQVPIKVIAINDKKERIMEDIAKASNQANVITELDLLANKPLTKKLKKYFSDRECYLKVKDGELLNDVLLKDDFTYDFTELLKIWLSVFLSRPNDAKFTKKNILLFNKAYINEESNKLKVLVDEKNFELVADSFYKSKIILDYQGKIADFFEGETYYEHANYFILFLIQSKYGFIFEKLDDEKLGIIKGIVEQQIETEREHKLSDGKEYTNNNYFKSAKPINDFLSKDVESITDKLLHFFT